jgi:integrase
MPKVAKELGALAVSRLTVPGWHAVGGVAGLGLQVTPTGARSWSLRVVIAGKRRELGLGGFPSVQIAAARDRAREARDLVRQGIDPILVKKTASSALLAAQARAVTFKVVGERYIESHEAGWGNPKHAAQWTSTLARYAYPELGDMLVASIDTAAVLKVLQPIWSIKTETATRVRGRIESILDYATAQGLREGPNPARWKGHLALTLPKRDKVQKVEHHAALPVSEMPGFMKQLRAVQGVGARALEFAILTAARSGEVRGMRWAEVDLEAKVWTVPAARMKAGRDHRVPLSDAAAAILHAMTSQEGTEVVFPGTKGQSLSDMSLTVVLRRLKVAAVPHGMRSSFRDWTAERTNFPNEVAEMALAHAVGDKVEAAYRRGDLFEKRRLMMSEWAKFLSKPSPSGTVVPIAARRGKAAG